MPTAARPTAIKYHAKYVKRSFFTRIFTVFIAASPTKSAAAMPAAAAAGCHARSHRSDEQKRKQGFLYVFHDKFLQFQLTKHDFVPVIKDMRQIFK